MDVIGALGLISPTAAAAAGALARERLHALADRVQETLSRMGRGRSLVQSTQGHAWDSPTARLFDHGVLFHLDRASSTDKTLEEAVLALRMAGEQVQQQAQEISATLAVLERQMSEGLIRHAQQTVGAAADVAGDIARGQLSSFLQSEELMRLQGAYEHAQSLLPLSQNQAAGLRGGG